MTSGKLERRLVYLNDQKTEANFKELEKVNYQKKERDLTVEGITYITYRELERAYGINQDTIRHRLDAGKTIEEAVGLINTNDFPLEFRGLIFKSYTEIARYYNVDPSTFMYRFNKAGWTL